MTPAPRLSTNGYPQFGHGAVPRALYSFTATRSWTDSGAWAGSPVPPQRSQVAWSNWYLPWERPSREIARGLPPDSHWAIRWSTGGTLVEPLLPPLLGAVPPFEYDAERTRMPSARRVAGPATPSAARPRERWKCFTARLVCGP